MADETRALDAYSAVVTSVADRLLPSVASLHVRGARGEGSGSAVVLTPDGFLLTSAHVVAGARDVTAAFADGSESPAQIIGADVLSDLAVLRSSRGRPGAGRARRRLRPAGRAAGGRGRQPARSRRQCHRRRGQRARPVPADQRGPRSSTTSSRPTPRSTPAIRAARSADAEGRVIGINTAVAGIGLGLAVPVNDTTRRIIGALMHDGRVRRAYLGIAGARVALPPQLVQRTGRRQGVRVAQVVQDSPAGQRRPIHRRHRGVARRPTRGHAR